MIGQIYLQFIYSFDYSVLYAKCQSPETDKQEEKNAQYRMSKSCLRLKIQAIEGLKLQAVL